LYSIYLGASAVRRRFRFDMDEAVLVAICACGKPSGAQ